MFDFSKFFENYFCFASDTQIKLFKLLCLNVVIYGFASPRSGDYIMGTPPILINCQMALPSGVIGVIFFNCVFT